MFPVYSSRGRLSIDATVPDTITSWVAEAFSFSQQNGLGISAPASLTVAKPFFISLELPFSINFEEEVSIVVLIFNFNSEPVTVSSLLKSCLTCLFTGVHNRPPLVLK